VSQGRVPLSQIESAKDSGHYLMGGDVTVTSEPGKGSVFTVRLPGGPTH